MSYIGQKFNRLTVITDAGRRSRQQMWRCRCDCGAELITPIYPLKDGRTKSCGCWRKDMIRETKTKHGMVDSPEYNTWRGIINRCNNRLDKNYGGRGIVVCARWRKSFGAFLADMGLKPSPLHSIDRRNPNGPYRKSNCRWALPAEQARNRRNTPMLRFRGESRPLTEWAAILNIAPHVIRNRMRHGWSIDSVLGTPAMPHGANQHSR